MYDMDYVKDRIATAQSELSSTLREYISRSDLDASLKEYRMFMSVDFWFYKATP